MTAERETLAEAMCPPHHREGILFSTVGQPMRSGPTMPCRLHVLQAEDALAWLAAELARPEMVEAVLDAWRPIAEDRHLMREDAVTALAAIRERVGGGG